MPVGLHCRPRRRFESDRVSTASGRLIRRPAVGHGQCLANFRRRDPVAGVPCRCRTFSSFPRRRESISANVWTGAATTACMDPRLRGDDEGGGRWRVPTGRPTPSPSLSGRGAGARRFRGLPTANAGRTTWIVIPQDAGSSPAPAFSRVAQSVGAGEVRSNPCRRGSSTGWRMPAGLQCRGFESPPVAHAPGSSVVEHVPSPPRRHALFSEGRRFGASAVSPR